MTYEEFQAELTKTPELINDIYEKHEGDFTKHLTSGKKMVVTTMDEYKTTTQKAIDEAIKKNHEGYQGKLEKITGEKKNAGESGHEYFDRLSAKIKYVTEDGADPNSAIIKGLQKELNEVRENLTKRDKEAIEARKDAEITVAIKGVKFAVPAHLKKEDEKTAYQRQKAEDALDIFNSRYKTTVDESGRFVYSNKKGEAQTKDGQPMTAEEIVARDFANEMAPRGNQQGGAGSGGNDNPGNGNVDYLGATTEEIRTKIAEKGVKFGTNEWKTLYEKAHVAAGYTKKDGAYVK